MSPESFKYLLNVVGPVISKKGTQQSLSFSFRIAKSTISNIVNETCAAIWEFFRQQYLAFIQPLQTSPENAETTVKATICLHNFFRHKKSAVHCPSGFVDSWDEKGEIKEGEWRRMVTECLNGMLSGIPPFRVINLLLSVRENIKSYLYSMEGSVSWQ